MPQELLDKLTRLVYRLKSMPDEVDSAMTLQYFKDLWGAVTAGYGDDLFSVDFDTPDYIMLRKMQENVMRFSAAKNYQQLKDLTKALIGDDGKLRTWSEFKQAAYDINGEYVQPWLKAEYNLAVANGQMASKWTNIQENIEALPLLEFDAVMDDGTTALCASLNGVIRPANDDFWNMYYPPNHWGCRSTVRQLATGTVTPIHEIDHPELQPMFRTNMARKGEAFPPDHPYFHALPHQVTEKADKLLKQVNTKKDE